MRFQKIVVVLLLLFLIAIPSRSIAGVAPAKVISFLDAAVLLSDQDEMVDYEDIRMLVMINVRNPEEILSQIEVYADADDRVSIEDLSKVIKEGHAPVKVSDALAILSRDRNWNNVLKFLKNSSNGLGPKITNDVLLDSLAEMADTTPEKIQLIHTIMRALRLADGGSPG